MKKWTSLLLALALLLPCLALGEAAETVIDLSNGTIAVNGTPISEDKSAPVYLALVNERHEDVPEALRDLQNRVVTITEAGTYRIRGEAADAQIAVKAGNDDAVRLILDGASITCRTAPAIAVYSGLDPRIPGAYGVTLELADGSVNSITGSHAEDERTDVEFDGAVGSQISLGIEGAGSLTIDADKEGIEVASGHLTIDGGHITIAASDDPLNVAEDDVGVLTMNDGYVFAAVKALPGLEGDGCDSNGYIVVNGGTLMCLAHPSSMDSGIDSDRGSTINGGTVIGAGNMYDPLDSSSAQPFMMLEFAEATDQLVVVTDENDVPVFAYDFPHSYTYISFSSPALAFGSAYRVYLGGEIVGTQTDGLYTEITSYTPGTPMQHGGGALQGSFGNFDFGGQMPEGMAFPEGGFDGQRPEGMPEPPAGFDGQRPDGQRPDGQQPPEFPDGFDGQRPEGMPEMPAGGFGGPRSMESSAESATASFVLTPQTTGFTNIRSAQ